MSHVALLQMVADDESSPIAQQAMAAIEQIAAQALALQEAERRIQSLEAEVEQLTSCQVALLGSRKTHQELRRVPTPS